jgi:hypothetical protein
MDRLSNTITKTYQIRHDAFKKAAAFAWLRRNESVIK